MFVSKLTLWEHVRVEAHELHIALGKWESEYFGTASQTTGAAHEQQVFRMHFESWCTLHTSKTHVIM